MRKKFWKSFLLVIACSFLVTFVAAPVHAKGNDNKEKIGVLYLVHGGFDQISAQNEWDVSVQMFSHDPNHMVYKMIIWNPAYWSYVLTVGNAPKELPKYTFNYGRIGGFDPFLSYTEEIVDKLQRELDHAAPRGVSFVVDYAAWMNSGDGQIEHFAYPRYLYAPPISGAPCTYCGEGEKNGVVLNFSGGTAAFSPGAALKGKTSKAKAVIADVAVSSGDWATGDAAGTIYVNAVKGKFANGEQLFDNASSDNSSMALSVGTTHWENCDKVRYNVDGPVERMLDQGIDRLVLVDLTTGGVRFFKTFDTIRMIKRALAANNSEIPVFWANDPTNLMEDSYPADPGWTPSLGAPQQEISVPLEGRPNPVIADPELAKINVQAIEKGFSPVVDDTQTGVILLNHAIDDYKELFDPKINDTLTINQNIKTQLLNRHPGMAADNIVGAFMGIKVNGQRTREQRGESLGEAWLYEVSPTTRPAGLWGFFYWDALEYLKNKGVKHIVIGFPQINTDSVLNLVEIPNQIAKEVGYKNWIKWSEGGDYDTYPDYGHPFADYWGVWVKTDCGGVACCFEMGGCSDNRSYPPKNQPALGDLNPYLAYDVSEFGHLGYEPQLGAPDANQPVQSQYTGTWAMYQPPNAKKSVIKFLKKHVLNAAGISHPPCNR